MDIAKLIVETNQSESPVKIGGKPFTPEGFVWPVCGDCGLNMMFVFSIALSSSSFDLGSTLVSIFMCQNDIGVCESWDPNEGANLAVLFKRENAKTATVPTDGVTLLDTQATAEILDYNYPSSDEEGFYYEALEDNTKKVIGKVGGEPVWVQGDETPDCDCGKTMKFLAQMEEQAAGGINFGGGAGYIFVCPDCKSKAKFLFQC